MEEAIAEMNQADVVDVAGSYAVRGHIAALRGDHEQGVELAERAVEIAERTDFFEIHANTYMELGHVLVLAGRRDEAQRPTSGCSRPHAPRARPHGRRRSRRC